MLNGFNKKIDNLLSKNFSIVFIILSVVIVVVVSFLLTYGCSYYFSRLDDSPITPDGYAALFGALGGGAMTLFGVLLTMKEQDKQRKYEKEEKERERLEIINQTKPIYEMYNFSSLELQNNVFPVNTAFEHFIRTFPKNCKIISYEIKVEDCRHQNNSETQIAHIAFYKDIAFQYKDGTEILTFKKEYLIPLSFLQAKNLNKISFKIIAFDITQEKNIESINIFPEILYKDFKGNHFRRRFTVKITGQFAKIIAEPETELISEVDFFREKRIFNTD